MSGISFRGRGFKGQNYGYVTPTPMDPDAKRVLGWVGKQTGDNVDLLGDGPAKIIGWYSALRPMNAELAPVEQVEPFFGGCAYAKVFGCLEGGEQPQERIQIGWLVL